MLVKICLYKTRKNCQFTCKLAPRIENWHKGSGTCTLDKFEIVDAFRPDLGIIKISSVPVIAPF